MTTRIDSIAAGTFPVRPSAVATAPWLRAVACGAGLALLAACGAPGVAPMAPTSAPAAAAAPMAAPASRPAPAAQGGSSLPPVPMKGSPGAGIAKAGAPAGATPAAAAPSEHLGTPFATKYARFEPVAFSALPGWSTDSLRESMVAFRQSCLALGKKPVWSDLCQASSRLDGGDDAAMRRFFEENFHAFSVLNPDQTDEGIITGYYEPLLEGSRSRSSRYPYPVHGVPADLLFLDAQTAAAGPRPWLSASDRRLVPAAPGAPGAKQYELALGNLAAGIRDKRYRVRIEGNRVLPYWSRQDIERRSLDAQTLAWVNDPFALYSMQIQGSGKIRLPNGELLRIAYAEQNGHPFLPQASNSDAVAVGSAIKTRGLKVGGASVAATSAALGAGHAPPAAPSPARPQATAATQRDPEVARMIAMLQGRGSAAPAPSATPRPAQAAQQPSAAPMPAAPAASSPPAAAAPRNADVAAIIAALSGKAPAPASGSATAQTAASTPEPAPAAGGAGTATGIPDPSYVFFRLIPDGPQGPLGALGVPLTAGRSIAVDPRTTPLGYPVFVSTGDAAQAGSSNAVNRLMFAQDTGGAIRGSVRADYFWGFGPNAGSRAASMKETGRMWLLLPRDLQASAETLAVRTRSLGGSRPLPECVVPDPENCVED